MTRDTVHTLKVIATDASGNEHVIDCFHDTFTSLDTSGEAVVSKGPSYYKTADGKDVTKEVNGNFRVVATGLELVMKGPKFTKPVGLENFFEKLGQKSSPVPVQPAPETQAVKGQTFVWKPHKAGEHTKYHFETAEPGWDNLAVVLEAQFAKIGELLASTYAQVPYRRIYFDFMPDTGRILGIPCAGDITKRNDFPMTVEVCASFLCDLYEELPESEDEDERDGDDPVWIEAFDANVALFRAALLKALTGPASKSVLSGLRRAHPVDCYLQISDGDEDIEKLPV